MDQSMVLVKNWPFFHLFLGGNIGQENVSYHILERKNVFLSYKNKKFKKWKNCHFPKGVSPWFWSKIGHFSIFFLKVMQARKMWFTIFQNKKDVILSYKNKKFKKRKIVIFAKRLVGGFGQKSAIFPNFFKGNIIQENVLLDILEQKSVFLGYKNKKFKKWKNCRFSEGVSPWIWSEIGHFSIFFFQAVQARKISFTILQNQKTPFQAIKRRSSKSGKIAIFPKELVIGFRQNLAIFFVFFFYR